MIPPAPSPILTSADSSGWRSSAVKTRAERSENGQFFTPLPIARRLADWFKANGLNRPSLHLLDPGAGGGVLTAAVVDRITALHGSGSLPLLREVTLEAWEFDDSFLPTLTQNLVACSEALRRADIHPVLEIHHGSYIEGAVRALDPGLFGDTPCSLPTHAILNPPYRKISTSSRERALLASVGIETSNLYAAFVWLALRQLTYGGELSAITPRSFCNGPYFREFRHELLANATFQRVHLFDSRTEAFGRDEVLQENILFHLIRNGDAKNPLTLRRRAGLSTSLARGLCRFLNSTVTDRFFRQFNGHTQVNATDLRAVRYPDTKSLERLGRAPLDDTDQTAIDLAMTEQLGAPPFPLSARTNSPLSLRAPGPAWFSSPRFRTGRPLPASKPTLPGKPKSGSPMNRTT